MMADEIVRPKKKTPRELDYSGLAAEIAKNCIVTKALGRLIEQVVKEATLAAKENERARCASICENWTDADHISHDIKDGIFPTRSRFQDALAAKIREGE